MKKWIAAALAVMLLFTSGCSFKIDRDMFYLPQDQVESVEIQREYHYDDDSGSYFRHKVVTVPSDMQVICEEIRKLPVYRASNDKPHPIVDFSMIIIIGGEREHHVILNEDIMFYDQIAYEYSKEGVYQKFVDLYNNLGYAEVDTEPNRF